MGRLLHELVAGLLVLATLIGLPLGIAHYQRALLTRPDVRGVELTAVRRDGVWTEEPVQGWNYWRRTFRPATITLREGEEVVLRLTSADVTHGFSAPELGVGPVDVEPGHVVEVRLKGIRSGKFLYFCRVICGDRHFFMHGDIRVVGRDESR
jgi:heme/copper-type cytochrome/quinol oxidase subunit 2